jgi:hypothetical protein
MTDALAAHVLEDAVVQFQTLKKMADRAIAQVDDEQFFTVLDPESNSIAIIVKHIAGNQRSRWTEFLNSDGEKPDRNRDAEFETDSKATREDLLRRWEEGWACLWEAVRPLEPRDLMRTVKIRGEDYTVLMAINRQLTHYAAHIGQIVFLAKHFRSGEWRTLSIPRAR